ncbi:MAG: response regulator [Desulfobacteraceae bacterium]|nr:response regulator [Desulfobacteraceae bacterium]
MNRPVFKKSILIVDDNSENIRILASLLKEQYRLMVCTSGQEALEHAVSDNRPDLILLDIVMPEMDGYEVCSKLKADSRTQNIPVIFITAMVKGEEKTRGFEVGAVDYITKPFFTDEIFERIRPHLHSKESYHDLEKMKPESKDKNIEQNGDIVKSFQPQKEKVSESTPSLKKIEKKEEIVQNIDSSSNDTGISPIQNLKIYIRILATLWTLVIVISIYWNINYVNKNSLKLARMQAITAFEKDLLYRRWNALYGTIYAPVSKKTPPNPFLTDIPEREITTPSGKLMTIINPAYMTRQVHEIAQNKSGVLGHITSLNPIRPKNSPDPWEFEALELFERGKKQVSSVQKINGIEYMRLMRPLITEKGCLKCHAKQGYKEGDIRGGISVAIPMKSLNAISKMQNFILIFAHVTLWLLGMAGIVWGSKRLIQSELKRNIAEKTLLKAYNEMEVQVSDRTMDLTIANEHLRQEIIGHKKAKQELNKYRDHLEVLVKERTGELVKANEKLRTQIEVRKQADTALKKANLEVETANQELIEANELLEKAVAKAKKMTLEAEMANKARGDFLSSMSHEIRTPMNAIIGLTDLVLKTKLKKKQSDYLGKVLFSSKSLLGIINDILDFSKIEAGKLKLENIDFILPDILNNIVSIFYVSTAERQIELMISLDDDVPWYMIGDPLRLGQILTNLTSNAVKFTPQGEILISVSLVKKNTDLVRLCFSVSDTGIGIPPDKVSSLFKSFSQADSSTTRKYGGTGLGLSICKRLVEMMNGKIWVESKFGEGSSFIFEVQFNLQVEKKEQRPMLPPDLKGMHVLVADDNVVARNIMGKILKNFSLNVILVTSGEEVLKELRKMLEKKPYDLLILDWNMPGMNGIDTCKKIKNDRQLAAMPLILMSAFDQDGTLEQCSKQIGINAFLTKPANPSILLDAIMEIFGHQAMNKKIKQETDLVKVAMKSLKGGKILLVEDNKINQLVATEVLKRAHIIVETADNGKKALEIISNSYEGEFDAILMDIQMPEMDGYEATRAIRNLALRKPIEAKSNTEQHLENTSIQNIPIIAMTAHAMTGDKEKCLIQGMNDYVTKPIDPDQLFLTLIKWIKPGDIKKISQENQQESSLNSISLPEHLSEFNLKTGLDLIGGDKILYMELLVQFFDLYKDIIDKIKADVKIGEMKYTCGILHEIKGVAANLGAEHLSKSATRLEQSLMAKELNFQIIEQNLEGFAKNLNSALYSIKALKH